MATLGNLELRLHGNTLYASTTHDGYTCYEIVPRLVEFFNSVRNPTEAQLSEWFRNTSKELFPFNYHEGLVSYGVPEEVVLDIPRKLILHTGHDEVYEIVSDKFPARFENSCILLKSKYDFEILNYVQSTMRKLVRSPI